MTKVNLVLSNQSFSDSFILSNESLTFLADVGSKYLEFKDGIPVRYKFEEQESRFDSFLILAVKLFELNKNTFVIVSIDEEKKDKVSIRHTDTKEVIDYFTWI